MKDIQSFIALLLAVGIGLIIGYFVFDKKNENHSSTPATHQHTEAEIYTCSMHPQIRQNEMGICPICEMDLTPLGTNNSSDPLVLEMTEDAVNISNIQTTIVGSSKGVGKTILLNGKVKADERLSASLVSHIPGRIEQLFVTFTGEQVKKGQKLATIYSPELVSAQNELLQAIKLKDISPGLLDAARKKLAYWKIPESTIQQIEASGKIQSLMNIYAESNGIVTKKNISVGDYLDEGSVLFETMNLNRVWVLFDGYEEDLSNIRIGNRIEFTTPARPNKIFNARVTYIDPLLNPETRAVAIRTEINNSNGLLKPEMFVRGKLKRKVSGNQKVNIPKTAVMWTGQRSVIYVKKPDTEIPSFEYREVTLGESLGSEYAITNGLELGEEVVVNGAFVIDAASQLNNQKSMMNKNVSIKSTDIGKKELPDFSKNASPVFQGQLGRLSEAYLSLKDAFVNTDNKAASMEAKNFLETLDKVDMSLVKVDAHLFWMEQLNAMQSHGKKITTLEDVEAQRKQFEFLTTGLVNVIKSFGTNNSLYIQYCPMAFNNKGAEWLSNEQQIRNPYFGDKMMKCGLVTDTLAMIQ